MAYNLEIPTRPCRFCGSPANYPTGNSDLGREIHCSRCGDFITPSGFETDEILPFSEPKRRALVSYIIRKLDNPGNITVLEKNFIEQSRRQSLPSPAEALDNFLLYLAEDAEGRPGGGTAVNYRDPFLLGYIGAIDWDEIDWIVHTLSSLRMVELSQESLSGTCVASITYLGWLRVADLKAAKIASKFAFFARKFDNAELDKVFERCLRPAVEETGYELRTVTQRAGLIDAVVEDEIRRCRFLIADLSDDNPGAYWEAGFAEGLGKPVIYLCQTSLEDPEKTTHFDTDHRQTVRWSVQSLDETAQKLKAVIRNTLLGDAKQTD